MNVLRASFLVLACLLSGIALAQRMSFGLMNGENVTLVDNKSVSLQGKCELNASIPNPLCSTPGICIPGGGIPSSVNADRVRVLAATTVNNSRLNSLRSTVGIITTLTQVTSVLDTTTAEASRELMSATNASFFPPPPGFPVVGGLGTEVMNAGNGGWVLAPDGSFISVAAGNAVIAVNPPAVDGKEFDCLISIDVDRRALKIREPKNKK